MKVRVMASSLVCDDCEFTLVEMLSHPDVQTTYYCDNCRKVVIPPYFDLEEVQPPDAA